ncbi:MFS transporter [Nonomuraea sp. NPDC001699]
MTSPPSTDSPPREARSRAFIPSLTLSGFTVSLINILPVPLLPSLPEMLGTTPASVYWTVTATLLVAAVSTPICGRLGDMLGKRRVLLYCLGLMVVGSVICGCAGSAATLIGGRALQGCAAGALPLGLSIMRDQLPARRLGRGLAAMSASVGLGGTVGFPLAAFISEHADWHALFWLVVALGVVQVSLVAFFVPESGIRHGGRFDWIGATSLSAGLVCVLVALSKGHDWGWTSPAILGAAVVGTVVIACWARYESRVGQPLVNLRTLRALPMLLTNVVTLLVGFAMFVLSLVVPQMLQAPPGTGYGAAWSMVEAGLALAPAGIAMVAVAPVSTRIVVRLRSRGVLLLGCGVIGTGYALIIPLSGSSWIVLAPAVVGVGLGLAFFAMPAIIAATAPAAETAAANGFNTLVRQLGAALSSALTSAVFANYNVRVPVGGVVHLYPSRTGLTIALLAACAACAVAAVVTTCIPRDVS